MPKRGRQAQAPAAAKPADPTPNPHTELNKEYLTEYAQALSCVLDNPVFKNVTSKNPIGIGAGGSSHAYKAVDCKAAFANGQKYEAAGNLFWLNMNYSPQPGVPYNRSRIMRLKQKRFPEARDFVNPLTVAVEDPSSFNIEEHRGGLRMHPN